MPVSVAALIARKREIEKQTQTRSLEGIQKGTLRGQEVASNIEKAKREKESKDFNLLNTLGGAGVGFLVGGPVGAVAGGVGAPRGKKFKPLETVGAGVTAGIAGKAFGTDIPKAVGALSKVENLNKTIPLLKSAGVPSKILAPLEGYSKLQAEKVTKERELSEKRETQKLAEEGRRKTQLEVQKVKAETARSKEKRKVLQAARKEALARYDGLSSSEKKEIGTKKEIINDYIQFKVYGKEPEFKTEVKKKMFGRVKEIETRTGRHVFTPALQKAIDDIEKQLGKKLTDEQIEKVRVKIGL
jgi:hypothetical protein